MIDLPISPLGPADGAARERLQQTGRTEARMLMDEQTEITPEQTRALLAEFDDWRSTQLIGGRPLTIKAAAQRLGLTGGVLGEVLAEGGPKYKGDLAKILRRIDQHLAEERQRLGLRDVGAFARIRLTGEIEGAFNLCVALRSMCAVIAEPGTCKSAHAAYLTGKRSLTYLVRVESAPADRLKVSELLCEALHDQHSRHELVQYRDKPHGRRLLAIKNFLIERQNAVLIIDEAQKLSANGLELLRDLHDPSGARTFATPVVFFADETFKLLIGETRNGKRTKMTSQFASRIYPLLDVRQLMIDAGGDLYTLDDIHAITRNPRTHVLTAAAARWLKILANVEGYGRLRTMMMVFRGALSLYAERVRQKQPLGVEHLQEAFTFVMTKRLAEEIDQAAGGELLVKAAG